MTRAESNIIAYQLDQAFRKATHCSCGTDELTIALELAETLAQLVDNFDQGEFLRNAGFNMEMK